MKKPDQIEIKDLDKLEVVAGEDQIAVQRASDGKLYRADKDEVKGGASTVDVHSTETGLPGTDAIVTNEGDTSAALFKFVIPRGDKGEPGDEVEMRVTATHIQWKLSEESVWNNLILLSELKGDKGDTGEPGTDGKEVELRKEGTNIEWRLTGGDWATLVPLAELKGDTGAKIVSAEFEGDDIKFTLDDSSTVILTDGKTELKGLDWQGEWSAGTYTVRQAVQHTGSSWVANKTTTQTPSLAATDWDLIARRGEDGEGSGDMLASVYDPAGGERQVAFDDDGRFTDAREPLEHGNEKHTEDYLSVESGHNEGLIADPVITFDENIIEEEVKVGVKIDVPSVDVYIRNDATWGNNATLYRKTVPAKNLSLQPLGIWYVYVSWNSGNPEYFATQDRTIINNSDIIPVARVCVCPGIEEVEYIVYYGAIGKSAAIRNFDRVMRIRGNGGFEKESGFAISELATRRVNIESGIAWLGLRRKSLAEVTQDEGDIKTYLYYRVGGNWTRTLVTQYNNSQYDNGNLVTLTANRFAVNWIYRNFATDEIAIVLGNGNYTLAQAEASMIPPVPPRITDFHALVGRIIVREGDNTATKIENVVTTAFQTSSITNHNDLGAIDGGQEGQYFHLTQAQHTRTNQAATSDLDGYLKKEDWVTFNSKQDTLNKATGAELDTGTDDAKFATAKALRDSKYRLVDSAVVEITVADWDGGTEAIKTVTGVTATSLIWVAPAVASYDKYIEFGIRATAQGTNEITFTADSTPDATININVIFEL